MIGEFGHKQIGFLAPPGFPIHASKIPQVGCQCWIIECLSIQWGGRVGEILGERVWKSTREVENPVFQAQIEAMR